MTVPGSTTITAPEGVELELPTAGPALRIFAYAIDYVLLALVFIGLLVFGVLTAALFSGFEEWIRSLVELDPDGIDPNRPETAILILFPILLLVFIAGYFGEVLYFTFWEMVTGGRSPGKLAVGLRVVRAGGQPLDFRSSLIRNLMRIVDNFPSQYMVGFISLVLSERVQRLGDHAAGTVVIRRDPPQAAPPVELPDDVATLPLTREQLRKVGQPEIALVRGTLRRVQGGTDPERSRALIDQAVSTLAGKLELDRDDCLRDPERFLEELLATIEADLRR